MGTTMCASNLNPAPVQVLLSDTSSKSFPFVAFPGKAQPVGNTWLGKLFSERFRPRNPLSGGYYPPM